MDVSNGYLQLPPEPVYRSGDAGRSTAYGGRYSRHMGIAAQQRSLGGKNIKSVAYVPLLLNSATSTWSPPNPSLLRPSFTAAYLPSTHTPLLLAAFL